MSKREKRLKAVSRLDQVEIIHEEPCSVRWHEMDGKLCAAFYARADGTMTLKPCAQEKKAFLQGRIVIRPQP